YYEVLEAGYKFNTTDMNSALGLAQLKRLKWFEKKRKEVFDYYGKELMGLDVTTPTIRPNVKTSYHLYPILLESYDRNKFIDEMKAHGIGTSVHFIPLHLQPFYRRTYKYKKGDFPVVEEVYRKIVSLPIYPQLKKNELSYITSTITKILDK
ncbi:MAG: DegT/DnrJ/EryC1/StrS family aminotransferase, partial [Planctomycetes bacterium]|nr:DegT/DnrJ/EryC1/StrS family aminotransferase [Planctomycetota bacterium]